MADRLLLVDDDERFAKWACEALAACGYETRAVPLGGSAVEEAVSYAPAVVLMDVSAGVGGSDGILMARRVLERVDVPVVFLCELDDWEFVARRARQVSDYGFLRKSGKADPWNFAEVVRLAALRHRERRARPVASSDGSPIAESGRFADPVLDSLLAPVALKDESGALVACNAEWERLCGRPVAELVGTRGDSPPFSDPERAAERLESLLVERGGAIGYGALSEEGGRFLVTKRREGFGDSRWIVAFAVPDARPRDAAAVAADRGLYDQLLDRTPAYIAVYEYDGRVVFANEAYASVFGLAPRDMIGRSLVDFVPDRIASGFLAAIRRAADSGEPFVDGGKVPVKGTMRAVSNLYFRLEGETGSLPRVGIVGTDVTELAERGMLLEIAERRNSQLLEELGRKADELGALVEIGREIAGSLSLPVVLERIALRACRLLSRHTAAVFMKDQGTGLMRAAATAGSVAGELASEVFPVGEGIVGGVAAAGEPRIVNDLSRTTDSVPVPGAPPDLPGDKLLAVPISEGEEVIGVLAVWRAPDEREFDEADLSFATGLARQAAVAIMNAQAFQAAEESRAAAEEANRQKSRFLANVSHELRTPLNAIINFAYLLSLGAEGAVTAGQGDLLSRIEESGRHLLQLIGDLLDLAKIEAGKLVLSLEDVDLAPIAREVAGIAEPMLSGKPVVMKVELPEALPPVRVDATRVKQVLLNLASNAAKFTESGSVTISVTVESDRLLVAVRDTGIGIPQSELARVFDEFTQVEGSLSRRFRGTGLGLPISKRLVEMHGGTMWVESVAGAGSSFLFTLPMGGPA